MFEYKEAREWLKEAGQVAWEYYRNAEPSIKNKTTYMKEVDLKVQEILIEKIDKQYPDIGILAEEGNLRKEPKGEPTYFVLDPIDGTASFISGFPSWGIAFGVIESSKPSTGYFYMPATDDFFYTDAIGSVYRNDSKATMKKFEEIHRETLLLGVSRIHRNFKISPEYPGKVRSLGAVAAHICYVATGSADAALVSGRGVRIWDIVPGLAMLHRNGGTARYINGDDFIFTNELLSGNKLSMPVLFGHEKNIEYFIEHITTQ